MHRDLRCQRVNTCKALMCLVHMLTTAHIPNKSRTSVSNTSRVLWCGEWDICFSEWCMFHIWMQFLCLTQQPSIVNILHNICQTHVYKLNVLRDTHSYTSNSIWGVCIYLHNLEICDLLIYLQLLYSNFTLHHLLTNRASVVNGCHQNKNVIHIQVK